MRILDVFVWSFVWLFKLVFDMVSHLFMKLSLLSSIIQGLGSSSKSKRNPGACICNARENWIATEILEGRTPLRSDAFGKLAAFATIEAATHAFVTINYRCCRCNSNILFKMTHEFRLKNSCRSDGKKFKACIWYPNQVTYGQVTMIHERVRGRVDDYDLWRYNCQNWARESRDLLMQ